MLFRYAQRNLNDFQKPKLCINDIEIESVEKFNFLGITFDQNLTWKPHIQKIGNKISKTIGVMARLKNVLNEKTLKLIYNSLILPYLHYGILVWGYQTDRLLILQKKALRILTKSHFIAHTDKLFSQEKILKVNDIFNMQCILFYRKFVLHELPTG